MVSGNLNTTWFDLNTPTGQHGKWYEKYSLHLIFTFYLYYRAGVKYVLSNTNTNTKIWIFQIQIQIFCSTLIQIQIQIHRFKYKYKYVQPNISAETVQIRNRAIVWIPRYMLMACVSLCLLLLISMLWHRQAIFESKGDKLSSSAEGRIRTQGLRYLFTSRLNACWQTDWAIEDQAKNLNSTARPYDQQAFSPLDLIASWLSHLALSVRL